MASMVAARRFQFLNLRIIVILLLIDNGLKDNQTGQPDTFKVCRAGLRSWEIAWKYFFFYRDAGVFLQWSVLVVTQPKEW